VSPEAELAIGGAGILDADGMASAGSMEIGCLVIEIGAGGGGGPIAEIPAGGGPGGSGSM